MRLAFLPDKDVGRAWFALQKLHQLFETYRSVCTVAFRVIPKVRHRTSPAPKEMATSACRLSRPVAVLQGLSMIAARLHHQFSCGGGRKRPPRSFRTTPATTQMIQSTKRPMINLNICVLPIRIFLKISPLRSLDQPYTPSA